MLILLLVAAFLFLAWAGLAGFSGAASLASLVTGLPSATRKAANSDVLIRWDNGSVTTHGQARKLAKEMRKTRKRKPAPAPFVRGTPDGMFAVQRLLAQQSTKPKQPRYLT